MNETSYKELASRITEIEWHGRQNGLRVQPHLYPKGLFKVQSIPVQQYQLASYIEELRQDLHVLQQKQGIVQKHFLAQRLKQKIYVLVNSLKSQTKPKSTLNPMASVLNRLNPETDSIYEYYYKQKQGAPKQVLDKQLLKLNRDLAELTKTKNEKYQVLQSGKSKSSDELKRTVLALSKQIGQLEQKIAQIKEALAQKEY
jgi:hypothetical protein